MSEVAVPVDWSRQRVLVTGAGGFIGSHLAERLVSLGARVRAFVRYSSSNSWGWLEQSTAKDDLEIMLGDIRDQDSVRQAMEGIDVVFHLAALIGIPYSYHTPQAYVRTNIEGTLNILQTARERGIRLVVQTSTSEVYGTARYVPIDEDHPLQGQSPYAASKIAADQMAQAFHRSFDLPVVTVRPFNTFGPRQSARAIVPTIITQCLRGGRIRLGNLSPTRDLNFVDNTVAGFIRAAEVPDAVGRTFNLGSGREISIGDLAHLVAGLTKTTLEIEQEAQRCRPRSSEVERLLASSVAAQQVLGWEPAVSLEQGLQMTVDWLAERLDAYRHNVYIV